MAEGGHGQGPKGRYASIRAALRVAVIIPTLDEEAALESRLDATLAVADQVVVSDGGSTDRTLDVASASGAVTTSGPAGRGTQLNRGAAMVESDVLVFLHADTELPENAIKEIRNAVANGSEAGGFLLSFDSRRRIFRLLEELINLRTKIFRAPLGDQTQFITSSLFASLGGFRDWPILEDLDLIRRARHKTSIAVLPVRVRTSARRYENNGVLRTIARNWLIWTLFLFGVSPQRLSRMYRRP